jgi:hypothetical protein
LEKIRLNLKKNSKIGEKNSKIGGIKAKFGKKFKNRGIFCEI